MCDAGTCWLCDGALAPFEQSLSDCVSLTRAHFVVCRLDQTKAGCFAPEPGRACSTVGLKVSYPITDECKLVDGIPKRPENACTCTTW